MTLAQIYARIPKVACRGLCAGTCGPIPLGELELIRVCEASGRELSATQFGGRGSLMLTPNQDHTCKLLKDGRCTVYEARPLICRAYGAAEGMECRWGCRPEGPLLKPAEMRELIEAAECALL